MIAPTTVRAEVTFKDAAGAAFDPSSLTFTLKPPSGDLRVYAYPGPPTPIVRDALGTFRIDAVLDLPGVWHWRWQSAGPVQVAQEGNLSVTASKVLA